MTDTLISHSDRKLVHLLLENLSAPFSVKGTLALLIFANTEAKVLSRIARRGLKDQGFHETLLYVLETNCPLLPGSLKRALEDDALERLDTAAGRREKGGDIEVDGTRFSRHEATIQIANGELSFDAILHTLFEQDRMDAAIWLIGRKLSLSDELVGGTNKSDADSAILNLLLQTGINENTYRDFLKARAK